MLKIIKWEEIRNYKNLWQDKKVVLVGGCFDVFHYGHLKFLQQAKKRGELLIIALESNLFIKKRKGKLPVHSQLERAEILSSLTLVDFVIILPYFKNDRNYFQLVKMVNPKVIATTQGDTQLMNKKHQASVVGAKVEIVTPLIKKFSSSKIINENIFSD